MGAQRLFPAFSLFVALVLQALPATAQDNAIQLDGKSLTIPQVIQVAVQVFDCRPRRKVWSRSFIVQFLVPGSSSLQRLQDLVFLDLRLAFKRFSWAWILAFDMANDRFSFSFSRWAAERFMDRKSA